MGVLVVKYEHNNWCCTKLSICILDESKGTMLQSASTVTFGVKVAHFFDLEGTLHGHRLSISLSQDETMLLVLEMLSNLFALSAAFDRHTKGNREPHQSFFESQSFSADGLSLNEIASLTEPKGNESEGSNLRGEGLGRCDSIFSPGIAVHTKFRRSRNQTSDCVHNTHDGNILVHRRRYDSVHILGLSTLRYDNKASLLGV
mmetsp:Transcript_9208/g.15273  ORF Transcript_9208/g.15273 Transcript_9208/m.15273 type:complete len:202 (-) Transcript_9208:120-725(-)